MEFLTHKPFFPGIIRIKYLKFRIKAPIIIVIKNL